MPDQPPPAHLFNLISGCMRTQAIGALVELGVPDAIAAGTTRTEELAREVGANADALGRILRQLEADGVVEQPEPGSWALTPTGELLRNGVPGSLADLSRFFAAEVYETWAGAAHSLRTGEPAFAERFGAPVFDWLQEHPDAGARFDRAMAGTATLRNRPLVERDWTGTELVVDVGGGDGTLLEAVMAAHGHLRGIVFDLPAVAERAAARLRATAVADRLRAAPGDFFADVPPGDAYVLAQVLHDWYDEDAARILAACRRAAPDGARLLVLEQLVPDGPGPSPVKLLDLQMLVFVGGRERTFAEFEALLAAAGWRLVGRSDGPRSTLLEAVTAPAPA
jgi:DNA-binding HxlR family transcriptional regulator/SAM-dependent methyltransferase